ncbi:arginase family protein [Saccharopolyspora elongata]|uniref:arginase family protein n=1 Tax=Saccharopolyspora elongata TaxID=2530387 RepID=UPI001404FF30|nr:arginase family protein [Saccharopolyspora elongata]
MKYLIDEVDPERTFLNAPYQPDATQVDTPYAFIGLPFGPPYHATDLTLCAGGADEVRKESYRQAYALNWDHYDFDYGDVLFPGDTPTVTDLGTLPSDFRNPDAVWDDGIDLFTTLISRGTVPLVVGAFDSIPPIIGGAFTAEKINVLQIDSHLDFRHERYGVTRGFSSPMRRLREYPWVNDIVQVGLRGAGSARAQDIKDALDSGNRLITAWDVHEHGAQKVLDSLTSDGRWLITIDCDGLDTSIAPAIGAREPGGLTFHEARTLVSGLARRNKVAALVFTEYQPALDIQSITAHTILRLMINVIGTQRSPKAEVPFTSSSRGTPESTRR